MGTASLVFVSGKGGTGKSAVASAIAIDRARRGQTVLAIDMGEGAGLAAHLRMDRLTYAPTEVRPGLHAMEMNRSLALDEYLKLQLHIPQGAPTKQLAAALSVLAETAPGVREIISIGKPIHEAWGGRWDAVVVDAPSLGQFQSYVQAPETIADLVPAGTVRKQAAKLGATLADGATTAIVLVTTPAELPMRETAEAIPHLREAGIAKAPRIVTNRTLEEAGFRPADLPAIQDGPLRQAAGHQLALEEEQARWIDEVAADLRLPYLHGILTPGEVALQLADEIGVAL